LAKARAAAEAQVWRMVSGLPALFTRRAMTVGAAQKVANGFLLARCIL